MASDAVVLGYIGFAGLLVSQITNIFLTIFGNRRTHQKVDDATSQAKSAYEVANGFNRKLETLKGDQKTVNDAQQTVNDEQAEINETAKGQSS